MERLDDEVGPNGIIRNPDKDFNTEAEWKYLEGILEHKTDVETAEKIKIAAIVHGGLSRAVLNNEAYKEKYGIDNPNIVAIQELKKVGVEFYLCGQSMSFLQLPQEDITPEVKVAISAKPPLSHSIKWAIPIWMWAGIRTEMFLW